eukprot:TRINITY_DN12063_c1_g1_i1.p1 TRINITY_DN12063_c1_g1~~TRINITY_DN12063_c1_g1_i1.p1  ORF type:complete len:489 (-),score=137.45 TRINITY_DN12063_c1_g1_i1:33-1472(-)
MKIIVFVILVSILLLISTASANSITKFKKQTLEKENCKGKALQACSKAADKKNCRKGFSKLCKRKALFEGCRSRSFSKCNKLKHNGKKEVSKEKLRKCRVRSTLKCRIQTLGKKRINSECKRRAKFHCKKNKGCAKLFTKKCNKARDAASDSEKRGELDLLAIVFVIKHEKKDVTRKFLPPSEDWNTEIIRKANCDDIAKAGCKGDQNCKKRVLKKCKNSAFFEGCRDAGILECGVANHAKACRINVTRQCRGIYLTRRSHRKECEARAHKNCKLGDKKCRKIFIKKCSKSHDASNPSLLEVDIAVQTVYTVTQYDPEGASPSKKNKAIKPSKRSNKPTTAKPSTFVEPEVKKAQCGKQAKAQCTKSGDKKRCTRRFKRGCVRRSKFHACKFAYANKVCGVENHKRAKNCRVRLTRRCRRSLIKKKGVRKECRARSLIHCPSHDLRCKRTFQRKCRAGLDAQDATNNGESSIAVLTLTK